MYIGGPNLRNNIVTIRALPKCVHSQFFRCEVRNVYAFHYYYSYYCVCKSDKPSIVIVVVVVVVVQRASLPHSSKWWLDSASSSN